MFEGAVNQVNLLNNDETISMKLILHKRSDSKFTKEA